MESSRIDVEYDYRSEAEILRHMNRTLPCQTGGIKVVHDRTARTGFYGDPSALVTKALHFEKHNLENGNLFISTNIRPYSVAYFRFIFMIGE